jgi:hypothetical protein
MKSSVLLTIALALSFASLCPNLQAQDDESRTKGRRIERKKKNVPPPTNNSPQPVATTGTLTGIVTDKVSAEPLYGVAVKIEGMNIGTTTDLDGKFVFPDLKAGLYQLNLEYISYRPLQIKNVTVKGGKEITIQVGMEESVTELESVQIIAEVDKNTDMAVLNTQKNSATILDGLSGDLIVKEASYYQMNNVLRRMPGITLIEDRFISFRGLFERYSNVVFNGTLLPVSDLERTGFDFASLPSGVVTQLQLQKSSTADQFSDFAGGLINITTADLPTKDMVRVSVQLNYNDMSSFKPFQSYPSTEAQGWSFIRSIERQAKDFPSSRQIALMPMGSEERTAAGRKFVNPLVPNEFRAPMGQNLNTVFQKRIKINKETDAGVTAYVNYFDLYKFQYALVNYLTNYDSVINRSPATDSSFHHSFNRQQNLTALLNLAISRKHTTISWKTLAVFNSEDMVSIADGVVYDTQSAPEEKFDYYYTYPIVRFIRNHMWSSQIEGQHVIRAVGESADPLRLTWNANYTSLISDEPGYKATSFWHNQRNGETLFDPVFTPTQSSLISRNSFHNWGARMRVQIPIVKHQSHISAGLFFNYAYRNFRSQNLGLFTTGEPNYQVDTFATDLPKSVFDPKNWRNVYRPENIGPGKFELFDLSFNTSNYDAFRTQITPFVVYNGRYKRWRFNGGLRLESFTHRIDTLPVTGPERAELLNYTITDLLPSLNVAYAIQEDMNLRFSMSQTVTRPADRELVPLAFFDLFSGTQSIGNHQLLRTKTTNTDLRYEFFPSGRELLSATVFYKYFSNPLEQIFTQGFNIGAYSESQTYVVENSRNAHAAGFELEARVNVGKRVKVKALEELFFIGNFTLLRSRVNKDSPFDVFGNGRALQGQAEYVLNVGLLYTEPTTKISAALFVNRAGNRLAYVGLGEKIFPSVVELPRTAIDLQFSRNFGKRSALQLALTDLLNQPIRLVQFAPGESTWREGKDQYMRILQRGFNVFLTYTWQLK